MFRADRASKDGPASGRPRRPVRRPVRSATLRARAIAHPRTRQRAAAAEPQAGRPGPTTCEVASYGACTRALKFYTGSSLRCARLFGEDEGIACAGRGEIELAVTDPILKFAMARPFRDAQRRSVGCAVRILFGLDFGRLPDNPGECTAGGYIGCAKRSVGGERKLRELRRFRIGLGNVAVARPRADQRRQGTFGRLLGVLAARAERRASDEGEGNSAGEVHVCTVPHLRATKTTST